MRLSILIPTMPERKRKFDELLHELYFQIGGRNELVEIFFKESQKGVPTLGEKRNMLLEQAQGRYVTFIDDDDYITPDYVETILKGLEGDPDCFCYDLLYKCPWMEKRVIYSTKYDRDAEKEDHFERLPNHLMVVKRELALRAKYPHVDFGEDAEFGKRIKRLIRTEARTNKILYHYLDFKYDQ